MLEFELNKSSVQWMADIILKIIGEKKKKIIKSTVHLI